MLNEQILELLDPVEELDCRVIIQVAAVQEVLAQELAVALEVASKAHVDSL